MNKIKQIFDQLLLDMGNDTVTPWQVGLAVFLGLLVMVPILLLVAIFPQVFAFLIGLTVVVVVIKGINDTRRHL